MASLTLESFLSWNALTDTVRVVKPGVPDVFPKEFYSITKEVLGNKLEYVQLYGTRKLANRVPYGAPGKAISKTILTNKQVELVAIKNQMVFDQEMVTYLRDFTKWEAQRLRCIDLLREQGEQFRVRFENTRRTSLGIFLATGKNWWDADYNMLPTSSGASVTIDQGIPAANIGTIADTYSAGGQIVNSSWALPTTDIVTQINNLKTLAVKQGGGYMLENAFYGRNVAGNISQNQSAKAFFPFDLPMAQAITKMGMVPKGFLDLEWVPVQNAFYDTEAGVSTEYFPADQVTFHPVVSKDTYTMYEGTTIVPGLFGVHPDAVAALNAMQDVTGMGRFAYWTDAQQIVDVGFDCFMPLMKLPASVFLVDTTP